MPATLFSKMQETLFPMVSSETPIGYFGSKTRAVQKIMRYIPNDVSEVVSPFLGGGSFELALTCRDIRVHGYDAYPELVNFWQQLLSNPNALLPHIKRYINCWQILRMSKRHDKPMSFTASE